MIDEWGKGAKYWDQAWNPMIGCRKISEGCANCYAARLAAQYPELQSADGGFEPHPPKHLKMPPKSGVVFVGNMTDLFGWWNGDEKIVKWLFMLSENAQNLVLTKRVKRSANWFCKQPYIYLGMTAENQQRYNERMIELRGALAHGNLWISAEPLIGQIDLFANIGMADFGKLFKWVVVGAESGPNRRPCKLKWVRQIVWQCGKAGVPVFVKQLDIDGKLVKDIEKFPEDLQIRQVPWGK